jgi:hypothetical protein
VVVQDFIAVLSGCAQAGAYAYYVALALRGTTWPNPMSWLMFAYGTTLVVVIETQAGANWHELLLPTVCAVCSIGIAVLAWHKGDAAARATATDWWTLRADVALTVGYAAVWAFSVYGALSVHQLAIANALFLIGVNATTFTSFLPLFMSALRDPSTEHPGPWILWSFAYLLLLIATAMNPAGLQSALLLIYPAINFILHTNVAALVLPERTARHD